MQILIYSNSVEAVEQLQTFCRELELPEPRLLGAVDIDTKLADLVAADSAVADSTMEDDVSDLSEPVILFYSPEKPAVTDMIRKYKAAGQWPIFAVLTPPALESTLAALIPQFLEDRANEQKWRERKICE